MSGSPRLFFQQFRKDFFHTGAILPSSPGVARACTAHLARKEGRVQVLEAGPGTGAFTREIVRHLEAGDALDLVEINPILVSYLHHQIQVEPLFLTSEARITLVNADLRYFPFNRTYDFIISSLPFTNFPPDVIEEMLTLIMLHLKPGGVFCYIKYIFIGRLKYFFVNSEVRESMQKSQGTIARFAQKYQIDRCAVLSNVPPAWVFCWQKPIDE
jgi:phospholipid N-methyltransferase